MIGGGVFYHDFAGFTATQATCFPLGILLCVAGVALLSLRGAELKTGEEDVSQEEKVMMSQRELGVTDTAEVTGATVEEPATFQRAAELTNADSSQYRNVSFSRSSMDMGRARPTISRSQSVSHPAGAGVLPLRRATFWDDPLAGMTNIAMLMQPATASLPVHDDATDTLQQRRDSRASVHSWMGPASVQPQPVQPLLLRQASAPSQLTSRGVGSSATGQLPSQRDSLLVSARASSDAV